MKPTKPAVFAKLPLAILASLAFCIPLVADDSPWKLTNRIAISSDGNPDADADDVGATPLMLAVLAKAGLQNNLVHYDFNNFLEYKKIDPSSESNVEERHGCDKLVSGSTRLGSLMLRSIRAQQ